VTSVTIDWDFVPTGKDWSYQTTSDYIIGYLKKIPAMYPVYGVKWRFSPSGGGLHILLDIGAELSDLDEILVRAVMHDDCKRLRLDLIRYLYGSREIGLIFSQKISVGSGEKKTAGDWIEIK
jgi:hypothetical protein